MTRIFSEQCCLVANRAINLLVRGGFMESLHAHGELEPTHRSADAHIREFTHLRDSLADVGIRAPMGDAPQQRAADVSSAEPSFFCRQDAGSTLRFMVRSVTSVLPRAAASDSNDLLDEVALDEREPLVAAKMRESKLMLVQTQLVENRRVDIPEMIGALDGSQPNGIRGADHLPPLTPLPAIHMEKPRLW